MDLDFLFPYFGEDAFNNSYDMLKEFAEYLKPLKSKYKITLEMVDILPQHAEYMCHQLLIQKD